MLLSEKSSKRIPRTLGGNKHKMEVQRIQFEVPIERLQELEKLMNRAGIATKKELLNNALTLLEWVVGEKARGYAIASVDRTEKRFKELAMPIFSNIKPEQDSAEAPAT